MPCRTCTMPSSAARWATACERRPLRMAGATPLCASILIPCPSSVWNAFSASPAGPYHSRPSVSTPSTSKIIRRTRRARSSAALETSLIVSDDFCAEQVVHVERPDELVAIIDHDKLVDLVAFHQLHSLDRE